ncbi:MAG: HD domain-containing phosphohydrolase [Solirubrobacterales bacterium]
MRFKGSFALSAAQWLLYATAGLFGAFVAYVLVPNTGGATADFFDHQVFSALVLLPALICLIRGFTAEGSRKVWLAIGVGILFWWGGDFYATTVLGDPAEMPVPSTADALHLLFYPAVFIGIFSLLRRLSDVPRTLWLQGVIAALSVAAIDAALVLESFKGDIDSSASQLATQLAYPMADLVILMLVVGARAVAGSRLGRAWNWLTGAIGLITIADTLYLFQSTAGTYVQGSLLDLTWPAAMLLMAMAALRDDGGVAEIEVDRRWLTLPSVFFAASAMFLVIFDQFHDFGIQTLAPATGALIFVVIEMALAQRENLRLLAVSRAEAFVDSVTGMPNRRALIRDLEWVCANATEESPATLILLDLKGFKSYNDKFGHLAGDALLARLGQNLLRVVGSFGGAYRHSGDEFCVIANVPLGQGEGVMRVAREALWEHGDGFEITGLSGQVTIPHESNDPVALLKLADQRLYAEKYQNTSVAPEEAAAMVNMLQATATSNDSRTALINETLKLAGSVMDLDGSELQQISRGFQLRDIGNSAVPQAILHKQGKLADHEFEVIKSHTIVGERILNSIPALRPVAEIVRYHHERFDGGGYPDGLVGEAIPIGARLVAIAQAFEAMISDRPFRPALSYRDAVKELGQQAGKQFDPRVVSAFCQALDQTSDAIQHNPAAVEAYTAAQIAQRQQAESPQQPAAPFAAPIAAPVAATAVAAATVIAQAEPALASAAVPVPPQATQPMGVIGGYAPAQPKPQAKQRVAQFN